jgi:methionine sulfoxide reductase heme-binding subunit
VELTSLVRKRLSHRLWKRVHFLSLPLFVSSTIHGLSAGTDGRTPMAIITAVVVTAGVAALVAVRIRERSQGSRPSRPAPAAPSPIAARRSKPIDRVADRTPVGVG